MHRTQPAMSSKSRITSGANPNKGYILCLNAGSSSLKFKLFHADAGSAAPTSESQKQNAVVSGSLKLKSVEKQKEARLTLHKANQDNAGSGHGKTHQESLETEDLGSPYVLETLLLRISRLVTDSPTDDDAVVRESEDEPERPIKIQTVIHRIVHGAHLPSCVIISRRDQHHLSTLEFLAEFAPLHNAISVKMIRNCLDSPTLACFQAQNQDEGAKGDGWRGQNVCCFDTTFHQTMGAVQSRYMVSPDLAGKKLPGGMEMKKFGFHGLSYSSILRSVSNATGQPKHHLNLIVCHLGSGSSICAIVKGSSFDTTMGLTPLEGLPGATRSGTVDPTLPLHISSHRLAQLKQEREQQQQQSHSEQDGQDGNNSDQIDPFSTVDLGDGVRVSHAELVLNKESGFKAVAGTSDFEEICKQRKNVQEQGSQEDVSQKDTSDAASKCALAFDMFVDRIVGYLGSYTFKMCGLGGVDALVFSGGIGEASQDLHQAIAGKLEFTPLRISDLPFGSPDQTGHKNAGNLGNDAVKQLKRSDLGLQTSRTSMGASLDSVPWIVCKTDEEGEMLIQATQAGKLS